MAAILFVAIFVANLLIVLCGGSGDGIRCPIDGREGSGAIDWGVFLEELFIARSIVFEGDSTRAKSRLLDLLVRAVTDISVAHECPLAVAATYLSIAHITASQGAVQIPLALIQMGFTFVQRNRGFRDEESIIPLHGWDMLLAGRALRHRQILVDERLKLPTKPSTRLAGVKFGVVSVCGYSEDEPVRVFGSSNHLRYTQLHGYEYVFFDSPPAREDNEPQRSGYWWKVSALQAALSSGRFDWLIWMDCDAFFMDPERTLDSLVASYASNEVELLISADSTGINNGVFLLRTSPWASDFLTSWWNSHTIFDAAHNCSDQAAMQYLLIHDRVLRLASLPMDRNGPDERVWPSQVRLLPQEMLNSFHSATANLVVSREWQPGDFIKHHPGCPYFNPACHQLYMEAAIHFEQQVHQRNTPSGIDDL